MSKERPILFNGAMVRAILAGQKSQTRRVMKHQPQSVVVPGVGPMLAVQKAKGTDRWLWPNAREQVIAECPIGQPGDRLWVRETFSPIYSAIDGRMIEVDYRATYKNGHRMGDHLGMPKKWTPSIHMPREACRLVLEITAVRVERLQDISGPDAVAEGIEELNGRFTFNGGMHESLTPRLSFQTLWDSTGGDWASNPWVWVIDFKKVTP